MNTTIGILNSLEGLIVVFVSYIDVVISICNRLILFCVFNMVSLHVAMYSVMCVARWYVRLRICVNSRRWPTFKICN